MASNERALRELRQKQHYFYFSELQKMAGELHVSFQQRLPYDLLSSLASSLLDGTVFEIVRSLEEVQHLEEKSLFSQRQKIVQQHKAQRQEMQKKHKELLHENQHRPHNLPIIQAQISRELTTMERRCEDELRKKEMKIILELDQKVMDQQVMMEKAGVPGFFVTNKPQEVSLQIRLLEFVLRLRSLEVPS